MSARGCAGSKKGNKSKLLFKIKQQPQPQVTCVCLPLPRFDVSVIESYRGNDISVKLHGRFERGRIESVDWNDECGDYLVTFNIQIEHMGVLRPMNTVFLASALQMIGILPS